MRSPSPNRARALCAPVAAAILAAGAGVGAGCTPNTRPELGKPYPTDTPGEFDLDVQVFRNQNRIAITNTSGIVFGEARVWVNAAYSLPIAGLAIGQRIELPLQDFRNEYGQPFRAGGFFATEIPMRVVKAEIVDERGTFELVVVRDVVD